VVRLCESSLLCGPAHAAGGEHEQSLPLSAPAVYLFPAVENAVLHVHTVSLAGQSPISSALIFVK
jgi:hypothetical protein